MKQEQSPSLKHYYANRERLLADQREYRKKNAATHQKTASGAWERKNPNRALWIAARRRAAKEGIPFDLEPDDVVIPSHCPVSGVPLDRSTRDASPSLDKIIPELGYVKGNIAIVSWRVNRLKSDATIEELKAIAKFYLGLS
jgi:hypothetical protein